MVLPQVSAIAGISASTIKLTSCAIGGGCIVVWTLSAAPRVGRSVQWRGGRGSGRPDCLDDGGVTGAASPGAWPDGAHL
jgi:hypothetical protein